MRWFLFARKQETAAATQFDELLDEVIDEFEQSVKRHRLRLAELREAIGGR